MEIKRIKATNTKQILANTQHFYAVGARVNGDGEGKNVLKAGTPVGGADSTFENEQAVLKVVSDNTVQGVLLHDIDVSQGTANATVLIWGFVNEERLDSEVTISKDVKDALDGKITFLKRNK